MMSILEDCKNSGLLLGKGGMYGSVLRIVPPMCINKDDVEFGLKVFKQALIKHRDWRAKAV